MNQIAFIIGEKFLYWSSVILALSILCTVCLFLGLSLRKKEERTAAFLAVPLALLLSMAFARLVHWYCRPQGYAGMAQALLDHSRGGYALIGAFFGCLLTALILRVCRATRNLPALLDHMALAGCLGICTGRLADLFTHSDRGIVLPASVPFPIADTVVNPVSGSTEVRLAVFLVQSILAGILFVCLMIRYFSGSKKHPRRDGDISLLFLLWYCGSQAVLDSPRYDSLYFRSNGFVSVVQIFGVLTVLGLLVYLTVRLLKAGQKKKIWLPLLTLPLLGGAGFMEYYVQRHGSKAFLSYSVMGSCMLAVLIIGTVIYYCTASRREKEENPEEKPQEEFPEAAEEEPAPQLVKQAHPFRGTERYRGKFS